jgi:hypothetical protein
MTYTFSLELTKENFLTVIFVVYVLYKFVCFARVKSQVLQNYFYLFRQSLSDFNRTVCVIGDYVCQKMVFDRMRDSENMMFHDDLKKIMLSFNNNSREQTEIQRSNLNLQVHESENRQRKQFFEYQQKRERSSSPNRKCMHQQQQQSPLNVMFNWSPEDESPRQQSMQKPQTSQTSINSEQLINDVMNFMQFFPREVISQKMREFKDKEVRSETKKPQEKKPLSSFMLFAQEKKPEILKQYPNLSNIECAVKIGQMWKNLSDGEKNSYKNKSQQAQQSQQAKTQTQTQNNSQMRCFTDQIPVEVIVNIVKEQAQEKQQEKQQEKPQEKQQEKPQEKPQEKQQEKPQEKPQVKAQEMVNPEKILEEQLKNFVGQIVQHLVEPKNEENTYSDEYDKLEP